MGEEEKSCAVLQTNERDIPSPEGNGATVPSPPEQLSPTTDSTNVDFEEDDNDDASSSSSDSTECCPICLNPTKDFVSGPCGHSLRKECMEIVLNANADVERWPPPSAADIHLSAPTLGRCPICRSVLSLFDIVDTKTQEPVYPRDTDYWKTTEREVKTDDHHHQHTPIEAINEVISSLSQSLTSSLAISIPEHPLKDAVYIPYRGTPGEMSFHWDWKKVKAHDGENKIIQRPFLNLTKAIPRRPDFWRLDDQSFPHPIRFMEEGCHFQKPSRTFHGTVLWPVPFKGSYEWDIILGFSKDYRFISSGRIHNKRGRKLKPGDVPKTYTETERELCKHPLDGRWTVVWENRAGEERRHEIHVINNEFRQCGWPFYLNFQDPSRVVVHWPRSRFQQAIVEGVDLLEQPMGPPVGERIRWETTDPNSPGLVWIRQTIGPNPVEIVHNYGMGQGKFLYRRLDADIGDSIPKYNGTSVFGNVFTKRLYIGSASYHFVSPTESFISYRHPSCRDLPPMDDGSPLPIRVDFRDLQWDPDERKLTARIEWEKDFGTSWNDNVRWKLTMHFDSEYMVILKGGIQCEWCKERRARPRPPRPPPRNRPAPVPIYVPPAEEEEEEQDDQEQQERERPPERNEEWVMSGYGHDQLYVNAACLERYQTKEESEDGDGEENRRLDYRALYEQHKTRLEKEGATKRTISFLMHLFQLADNDHENPIDFLL